MAYNKIRQGVVKSQSRVIGDTKRMSYQSKIAKCHKRKMEKQIKVSSEKREDLQKEELQMKRAVSYLSC